MKRIGWILLLLSAFAAAKETKYYHPVEISEFSTKGSRWTHVAVTGVVTSVRREKDGDVHIKVCDIATKKNWCFVAEVIEEISATRANVGEQVTVKGISRYDKQHKWWEIHPVRELWVHWRD